MLTRSMRRPPNGSANECLKPWRTPDVSIVETVKKRRRPPLWLRLPLLYPVLRLLLSPFPREVEEVVYAIWYGPYGSKGESATEVEKLEGARYKVVEYQDTTGYFDEPQPEGKEINVQTVKVIAPNLLWAVGLGVDLISYWGGDDKDTWTGELPVLDGAA